ncbi:MAG: dihydrolipoyl dehydrogenase [Cyanobacteriota bacterium]
MEVKYVDVAIIGGGTAGMSAYKNAIKYTNNVVLIEGGKFGTTCAKVGCMPSKLLISAADAAHSIKNFSKFGLELEGKLVVNGKKVMERVKSERDRFVGFVLESIDNIKEENIIRGYAKFIDNNTIKVDNNIIKAKSIVIATGSASFIPPFLKDLGDKLITSDDVFYWDDLPKSVAVFGSGVIGLEIGQALSHLGVKVKMFGRGGVIGPLSDPKILEYSKKAFSEDFYLDNDMEISAQVSRKGHNVLIKYIDKSGKEQEDQFEYVLAATGRKADFSKLDIQNTDLKLDDKGVPISDKYTNQCGNSSIFIAGDSSNNMPLLHIAADEGATAGKNSANFPNIENGKRSANIGIVFTDPQIAVVGKTYKELKDIDYSIGEMSFESQGRSRVMLKNKGLLHVYADNKTGRFLGAEMIGPHVEHLAHLLAWSYQQEMTISKMLEMPFYHPVIEEGLRTALRDVNSKLENL